MTVLAGATDHIHGARLGQAGEIEILFEMQSKTCLSGSYAYLLMHALPAVLD